MSDWRDKIEPTEVSIAKDGFSAEYEIRLSIAISLKRIADIMEGKQQPVIMSAEEYNKRLCDELIGDSIRNLK